MNNVAVIGKVAGAGSSNITLFYNFTDIDPGSGVVLYRLRQTDFDGSSAASDWVTVQIPLPSNITVATDNTNGSIIVNFNSNNANYTIDVYDLTGNCVARGIKINDTQSSAVISLQGVAKGIYIVRISTEASTITKKIFIG